MPASYKADRLEAVVADLCGLYAEYAICLEVESRAKVAALKMAQASELGVGATDNYTTISTHDAAMESLKLKWEIRAAECERDWLMFAIAHGL